jgi:hypothetical protein
MQPIADMEDDQFMKLQELYAAELSICGGMHVGGCKAAFELARL